MMREFSVRAYAKINFGLRVHPKRADGFHDIESIFQTIDVYDELIVTPTEKGCIVQCDSMQLPENNTLTKAFDAFCEVTGKEIGVNVKLIKGIPAGGGLGGGSSDAAALIRVLQKLCNVELSYNQLDYIAAKTGSDVFFFMHCDEDGRGCALVSGRGEVVKRIPGRRDLYLILIFPSVSSSTKEAYELVDRAFDSGNAVFGPTLAELEEIYNKPLEKWTFINTFTPVIGSKYTEIRDAVDDLKKAGCCYSEMSGSGSTVFGVFEDEQKAIAACDLLADTWNCRKLQAL